MGQVNPHWGRLLTCPNDPLPTPMLARTPQRHTSGPARNPVAHPNAGPRPLGQILWCGEAAEWFLRARPCDGREHGVLRRLGSRHDSMRTPGPRQLRPLHGAPAGTPAGVRAHARHRTRTAPPVQGGPGSSSPRAMGTPRIPCRSDPLVRGSGCVLPSDRARTTKWLPTAHDRIPAPPGRPQHRRAPPGTPHERITHSRVHILLHPCYDRTYCNRIHY